VGHFPGALLFGRFNVLLNRAAWLTGHTVVGSWLPTARLADGGAARSSFYQAQPGEGDLDEAGEDAG
jgi:hypothetical protein